MNDVRMAHIGNVFLSVILVLIAAVATAQTLQPAVVPTGLPVSERDALTEQRMGLIARRDALLATINSHNQQCSTVPEKSPNVSICQNKMAELQAEIGKYSESVKEFNKTVKTHIDAAKKTLEARIDDLRSKIVSDQKAIRDLGFEKRAEDFKDWESLASDAKKEFEEEVLSIVISRAISEAIGAAKQVVTRFGSFNPPKANSMISALRSAGIEEPFLFEAIRTVAQTSGKPEMAKAVNKFLDSLDHAKHAIIELRKTGKEPIDKTNQKLTALVAALSIGVEDLRLKILVDEIKFATASAYNNVARRVSQAQVERLTTLTEQELHDLRRLSDSMKKHVEQLRGAKERLAVLEASE